MTTPPTRLSAAGEKLIKGFESCSLRAYPDPASDLHKALTRAGLIARYMKGEVAIPAELRGLSGRPWTIGWGHTGPEVVEGLVWTQEQCDEEFRRDIRPREITVYSAVTQPITQGMFDALVSLLFNVGAGSSTRDGIIRLKDGRPSSVLRCLNLCDFKAAAAHIEDWNKAGGVVVPGLQRRRRAERALFEGK